MYYMHENVSFHFQFPTSEESFGVFLNGRIRLGSEKACSSSTCVYRNLPCMFYSIKLYCVVLELYCFFIYLPVTKITFIFGLLHVNIPRRYSIRSMFVELTDFDEICLLWRYIFLRPRKGNIQKLGKAPLPAFALSTEGSFRSTSSPLREPPD